ncbi:MAG: magnesium transporter [Actinobacteria bacterium]|nr:magnesium transporter [Actinomycetota bacterium]
MADRRRPVPLPPVPRPLKVLGRLLGIPIVEVRSYWAQESRSLRTGASALGIGLFATVIAGVVLMSAEARLEGIPGLLALIPAAIGMRGSIFGSLGSRLSTGIMTGEFDRQLTRRSYLGRQVEAATVLSFATATQAGVLAWAISVALGLRTVPVLDLVAISLIGGLLSSVVLFFVVIGLARKSEANGWNMDDVGAPIITAAGDLVTLPALLVGTLVLAVEPLALTIGALGVVVGIVAVVLGVRRQDATIRSIVRESMIVLTIAVSIDVLAGIVVQARAEEQFSAPALLVLIPPFIANCGSLGGMLSSRLASKLHVGLLEPRLFPGKTAALDFSLVALLGFLAFGGVGAAGWLAAVLVPGVEPLPLLSMLGVAWLAGLFATIVLAGAAYAAATTSFRFGFDPDNHGIPVVTATMDLAGVLCLVAAITILQVG